MHWRTPIASANSTRRNYRIAMPENIDFINADLRKDPFKDLVKAEFDHNNESEN
jgi:hypothetical protein